MQQTVSKNREKYIGGSDVPIIMNISQFKTRYQLLLEKALIANNNKSILNSKYGNAWKLDVEYEFGSQFIFFSIIQLNNPEIGECL